MMGAGDGDGKIGNGLPPVAPPDPLDFDDENESATPVFYGSDETSGHSPHIDGVAMYAVVSSSSRLREHSPLASSPPPSTPRTSDFFRGIVERFLGRVTRFASTAFPPPTGAGVEEPLPAEKVPVEILVEVEMDVQNSHPITILTHLLKEKAGHSGEIVASMLAAQPNESGFVAYSHVDGESASWTKAGLIFNADHDVAAFMLESHEGVFLGGFNVAQGRVTNIARFTGRIEGRTLAWKVENTDRTVWEPAVFERHYEAIAKIFEKDVTHIYVAQSPVHAGGGGVRSMRGGPVTYMLPPQMIGMGTMQMGAQMAFAGPALGARMPFNPIMPLTSIF